MAQSWSDFIQGIAGEVVTAKLAQPTTPVSTSSGGTPYVEGKPADFINSIPKGYVLIAVAGFAALILFAATR